MVNRTWGFWTVAKLDLLQKYLQAFVIATKNKSKGRFYIDPFAGSLFNTQQHTGERFAGSAQIALTTSNPSFTELLFYELPPLATQLTHDIKQHHLNRNAHVYGGDANIILSATLTNHSYLKKFPGFAFIDTDA